MNKIALISAATGVVCLGIGGAAGYFVAKTEFDKKIEPLITEQVTATKKHYTFLLDAARNGKPESVTDIKITPDKDEPLPLEAEDPPTADVPSPAIQAYVKRNAEKALTDYQGVSAVEPAPDAPTTSNVFDTNETKRVLPPRDPITKRFVPKQTAEDPQEPNTTQPYLIELEDFVENPDGHHQISLLYFADENTLLDPMTKEVADPNEVGEENLAAFPDVPEGVTSEIYIRNPGLEHDYDITKTTDNLTDWLGLGDGIGDKAKDSTNSDQSQWV